MHFRRFIASLLVLSLILPLPAQARLVGAEAALSAVDRDAIANVLQRADVCKALGERGVRPAHIEARLAALTDQEIGQLASRIQDLPAGGVVEEIV
jgi:hypothetical protein